MTKENYAQMQFSLKKKYDLLNTVQKIVKDSKRKTPFRDLFLKRNIFHGKRETEMTSKGGAVITEQVKRD